MSENETQSTNQTGSMSETTEPRVVAAYAAVAEDKGKSKLTGYLIAAVVVILIILGVLYALEKEGRSSTNLFGLVTTDQKSSEVVATVNGESIVSSDLDISVQQFSQAAAFQGVDISSPDAQAEIRNQALDVLVNTELLKQAAADKGLEVTEDEVSNRLSEIKTEIGGEDILADRMKELGIDESKLQKDVHDELLIQKLLDGLFLDADINVTEEEIASVYENASGTVSDLPALDEVREDVEAQIRASKEQEVIDKYLTELRSGADIQLL